MDQLFQMLATTNVSAVDVRGALKAGKPAERLYEKTGTHWDARGAFLAYREVIEAVRRQQPAVPPAWTREDFEPVARVIDAKDLAGMMGLKRVMQEEDLQLAADASTTGARHRACRPGRWRRCHSPGD